MFWLNFKRLEVSRIILKAINYLIHLKCDQLFLYCHIKFHQTAYLFISKPKKINQCKKIKSKQKQIVRLFLKTLIKTNLL